MPTIIDQPIDTLSFYNQIKDDYEQQKGLVHGLAKDAIQNCAGHRKASNATGWGVEIKLIENDDQTLLTITDWGTSGLIGHVPRDDNHARELRTDPEEKLAKIEMLLNDGHNVSGAAGSKGRGLTVFQHNSLKDKVMWDSLRPENEPDAKYVANARFVDNRSMKRFGLTSKDEEAHKFIFEHAGLKPLSKVGTRITIFSPREDLVTSIKDGNFAKYISGAYFELLGLYGENMDGIFIVVDNKRTKVDLEDHWKKYFNNEYDPKHVYVDHNINISFNYKETRNVNTRISKIVYILSETELDKENRGIFINRMCMAINQSDSILKDLGLPPEYKNRVFGYVKLETSPAQKTGLSLENMIKIAEDSTHYTLHTIDFIELFPYIDVFIIRLSKFQIFLKSVQVFKIEHLHM